MKNLEKKELEKIEFQLVLFEIFLEMQSSILTKQLMTTTERNKFIFVLKRDRSMQYEHNRKSNFWFSNSFFSVLNRMIILMKYKIDNYELEHRV